LIDLRFRPLDKWRDSPPLQHSRAAFKMSYNKTLDLLERELNNLKAKNIVIEAGFSLTQIRNDGWPYGGQAPKHAGVVLYFKNKEGRDLRFPSGRYSSWTANIHAIALTLESLRAIDRYGVTTGQQQYIGFAALEAPKQLTLEDAALFVSLHSGIESLNWRFIRDSGESFLLAYRNAAKRLHPDSPGADNVHLWNTLQQARELLAAHHGVK
jgi:hypothetical protein